MILTDAPNDFGGRLCLNCALTTPELPVDRYLRLVTCPDITGRGSRTMRPRNLSPNDPYLRSLNLPLRSVDERNLLSQVETRYTSGSGFILHGIPDKSLPGRLGIFNALDLYQTVTLVSIRYVPRKLV